MYVGMRGQVGVMACDDHKSGGKYILKPTYLFSLSIKSSKADQNYSATDKIRLRMSDRDA